jgi:hypothetical protein
LRRDTWTVVVDAIGAAAVDGWYTVHVSDLLGASFDGWWRVQDGFVISVTAASMPAPPSSLTERPGSRLTASAIRHLAPAAPVRHPSAGLCA